MIKKASTHLKCIEKIKDHKIKRYEFASIKNDYDLLLIDKNYERKFVLKSSQGAIQLVTSSGIPAGCECNGAYYLKARWSIPFGFRFVNNNETYITNGTIVISPNTESVFDLIENRVTTDLMVQSKTIDSLKAAFENVNGVSPEEKKNFSRTVCNNLNNTLSLTDDSAFQINNLKIEFIKRR